MLVGVSSFALSVNPLVCVETLSKLGGPEAAYCTNRLFVFQLRGFEQWRLHLPLPWLPPRASWRAQAKSPAAYFPQLSKRAFWFLRKALSETTGDSTPMTRGSLALACGKRPCLWRMLAIPTVVPGLFGWIFRGWTQSRYCSHMPPHKILMQRLDRATFRAVFHRGLELGLAGEVAMRKSPKKSLSTRHNLQSWMYGGSLTTAPGNNLATLCARFLDGRASTSSSVILLNLGLSPCLNTSLQVNSQSFPGGPSTDTRSSQTQFVALPQTLAALPPGDHPT